MSSHYVPLTSSPDFGAGVIAKRKMHQDGADRRSIPNSQYNANMGKVYVDGEGGGLFHFMFYTTSGDVKYASVIKQVNEDGTTKAYKAVLNYYAKKVLEEIGSDYVSQTKYGVVCGTFVNGWKSLKAANGYGAITSNGYMSDNLYTVYNIAVSKKDIANITFALEPDILNVYAGINNNGFITSIEITNVFAGLPLEGGSTSIAVNALDCNYDATEFCFTVEHSYSKFSNADHSKDGEHEYRKTCYQIYVCQIQTDDEGNTSFTFTLSSSSQANYFFSQSPYEQYVDSTRNTTVTINGIIVHSSGYYRHENTASLLSTDLSVSMEKDITITPLYYTQFGFGYFKPNSWIDIINPPEQMSYNDITNTSESGNVSFNGELLWEQKRTVKCTLSHTSRPGYDRATYFEENGEETEIDLSSFFHALARNRQLIFENNGMLYYGEQPMPFESVTVKYKGQISEVVYPSNAEYFEFSEYNYFGYNSIRNNNMYYCLLDMNTLCNIKKEPVHIYFLHTWPFGYPYWFATIQITNHFDLYSQNYKYMATLYGLFIDPNQQEIEEVQEDSEQPWVERVWDTKSCTYERRLFRAEYNEVVCDGEVIPLEQKFVDACVSNIKAGLTMITIGAWYEQNDQLFVKEWDGSLFEVDLSYLRTKGFEGFSSIIPGWD